EQLDARIRDLLGFTLLNAKTIHGSFRHDNFHNGFTPASAGNASRFLICIAAAADERGIADTAGAFAAGAACGRRRNQVPGRVDCDSANGTALMDVMSVNVRASAAFRPSSTFAGNN